MLTNYTNETKREDMGWTKNSDLMLNAYHEAWLRNCDKREEAFDAWQKAWNNESGKAKYCGKLRTADDIDIFYNRYKEEAQCYYYAMVARENEIKNWYK